MVTFIVIIISNIKSLLPAPLPSMLASCGWSWIECIHNSFYLKFIVFLDTNNVDSFVKENKISFSCWQIILMSFNMYKHIQLLMLIVLSQLWKQNRQDSNTGIKSKANWSHSCRRPCWLIQAASGRGTGCSAHAFGWGFRGWVLGLGSPPAFPYVK